MNVLGFETSCDETSASVVKDGKKILSNVVVSSLKFHAKYGGIVPEIAFRMQLETIQEVTQEAIKEAGIKRENIGLVSVTNRPGLLGSLFVGISFAKAVALGLEIPLIGVNHIHSHIYSAFLSHKKIDYPFIALVVSGGHTSLFFVKDFTRIQQLGFTQDDACGEAFDKVAKILDLGYPGGPQIERMASLGDPESFKFRCCGTKLPLNFSFSGIKTSVMYLTKNSKISAKEKKNIAASFQKTVIDSLVEKTISAAKIKKCGRIVVGGGVVANKSLRDQLFASCKLNGVKCFFPEKGLCMDNAAMVAGLGYELFRKGQRSNLYLNTESN